MASTRLRLRVVPGAAKPGLIGRYGDAWKLRVAAPPEGGAANEAVVDLVARTLGVPPRMVSVVSGFASRDKIVEVDGLGADETEVRLASAERKDQ